MTNSFTKSFAIDGSVKDTLTKSFAIDGKVIERSIGRPTKKDDETVGKLESAFKWGANVTEACLIGGISRDTFYKWIELDQKFSDKMVSAQQWHLLAAKKAIIKALRKGDTQAAQWWLERKLPDEFGRKDQLTVSFDPHEEYKKMVEGLNKEVKRINRQLEAEDGQVEPVPSEGT